MDLPAWGPAGGAARRRLLHDGPRPARNARWLTAEQRTWLTETLAAEESERSVAAPGSHRAAFRNRRVIALTAITVATMAAQTAKPLFWSLPTAFLAGIVIIGLSVATRRRERSMLVP